MADSEVRPTPAHGGACRRARLDLFTTLRRKVLGTVARCEGRVESYGTAARVAIRATVTRDRQECRFGKW